MPEIQAVALALSGAELILLKPVWTDMMGAFSSSAR